MLKELAKLEPPKTWANRYFKLFSKEIKGQIEDGTAFEAHGKDCWFGEYYLKGDLFIGVRVEIAANSWPCGVFIHGGQSSEGHEPNFKRKSHDVTLIVCLGEKWKDPAGRDYDALERLFYNILTHELRHYQQSKSLGLERYRKLAKNNDRDPAYFKSPLEIDAYSVALSLTAKKFGLPLREYVDGYVSNIAFDMGRMKIPFATSDPLLSSAKASWIEHAADLELNFGGKERDLIVKC